MRPRFHNPAFLQHDNAVRAAHGRQTMGDDDAGAALEEALQSDLDLLLRVAVDVGGGLVQDQDLGVRHQRAGEGEQLALAQG